MLRIRLQRRGRRKRPIHHIVVADSRKPRDGRIIEDIGRFDNITPKNELDLKRDRALYWLKQGAQPSDTVRSIFKNQGLMYEMHLIRWGKSEEEIQQALTEWREKREEKEKDVPTRKERQKALLEAEEKEFQKQLKKKAEEAAREKAKQKALAAEEETKEPQEDSEEESPAQQASEAESKESDSEDVAETEASAEKDKAETKEAEEAQTEEKAAEKEETPDEADHEAEAREEAEEDSEEQEADAGSEEEEDKTEDKVEASEEDTGDVQEDKKKEKTSADMLAKEAIDHIENTPLDELKGFVTEEEDRVTVQRALEEKQEGEEE